MVAGINFSKLTLMDALDLASLIEVEAYQRYLLFAEQIGPCGPGNAAAVFLSMAENEKKHGEQLAQRRLAMFGRAPARVTRDDIFDVEAPDVGAPYWNMSTLKAFEVALASEKKAYEFYDRALLTTKLSDVETLFHELREEEAEHVRMIEEIIAKLPPEAALDIEDVDEP
jgi:erythrin-vacuolar iron transport family protein